MLELPEAVTLASQMARTLKGRRIVTVRAGASPHKFAWYFGDPAGYGQLLVGRTITDAKAAGGRPEIWAGDARVSFSDGVNVRYLPAGSKRPDKHQLLLEFDDGAMLVCTVQMYGGLEAFIDGENDNHYYLAGWQKPSPLSDGFTPGYFASLLTPAVRKLSAKAFLATEQRIPGLGNGVLQDILWRAGLHPKTKASLLDDAAIAALWCTLRGVIAEMADAGGRSSEKDLFGEPGGYRCVLDKDTVGRPCPACGTAIVRFAYMGGNVYVCPACQPVLG